MPSLTLYKASWPSIVCRERRRRENEEEAGKEEEDEGEEGGYGNWTQILSISLGGKYTFN